MTRISFYVLRGNNEHDRQVFCCRLIEKAYFQGHQIYIHTENKQQAQQLNHTLWSFRDDSFIPHHILGENSEAETCPVIVGYNTTPPRIMDLLINLTTEQPSFFSQFKRVAELVNDDPKIKSTGRERYRFYQKCGYQLDTFTI